MYSDITIREIVSFWLGDALSAPDAAMGRRDWWYKGGAPVDAEIDARFGTLVPRARDGDLAGWEERADGSLALVLLLDQFTRNLYRGTPEAYSGDAAALGVMRRAIDSGRDKEPHGVERIWLYHPLHHSESLEDQDRGLSLLEEIKAEADPEWHGYVERSITGWTRHRNIVARFGRFPHRNAVLGRPNTPAETEFLAEDGESFGQGIQPNKAAD